MSRMLDRVPDTLDKREGSVIYTALAPGSGRTAKHVYRTRCHPE